MRPYPPRYLQRPSSDPQRTCIHATAIVTNNFGPSNSVHNHASLSTRAKLSCNVLNLSEHIPGRTFPLRNLSLEP